MSMLVSYQKEQDSLKVRCYSPLSGYHGIQMHGFQNEGLNEEKKARKQRESLIRCDFPCSQGMSLVRSCPDGIKEDRKLFKNAGWENVMYHFSPSSSTIGLSQAA